MTRSASTCTECIRCWTYSTLTTLIHPSEMFSSKHSALGPSNNMIASNHGKVQTTYDRFVQIRRFVSQKNQCESQSSAAPGCLNCCSGNLTITVNCMQLLFCSSKGTTHEGHWHYSPPHRSVGKTPSYKHLQQPTGNDCWVVEFVCSSVTLGMV